MAEATTTPAPEGDKPSIPPTPENMQRALDTLREEFEKLGFKFDATFEVPKPAPRKSEPPPPETIEEQTARLEKDGVKVVGPGYKPTTEEVVAMKRRTAASKQSREEFAEKCNALKENVNSIPSTAAMLEDFCNTHNLLKRAREASARLEPRPEPYKPVGIRARTLFALESLFRGISNWFAWRPAPKPIVNVAPEMLRTEFDVLRENIVEAMTDGDSEYNKDEFLGTCWQMVEATSNENLVRMPGETKRDALKRVVTEHLLRFEQRQKARMEEDKKIGLEDGGLMVDEPLPDWGMRQYRTMQLVKESAREPMKVKLGTTTDLGKIVRPDDPSLPSILPPRPRGIVAKLDDDEAIQDPNANVLGRAVGAPPEDPLLATAREARLRELLAKDEATNDLTEDEKDELADLTTGDVNVL